MDWACPCSSSCTQEQSLKTSQISFLGELPNQTTVLNPWPQWKSHRPMVQNPGQVLLDWANQSLFPGERKRKDSQLIWANRRLRELQEKMEWKTGWRTLQARLYNKQLALWAHQLLGTGKTTQSPPWNICLHIRGSVKAKSSEPSPPHKEHIREDDDVSY